MKDIRQIFGREGCEPITEVLIAELIQKGFTEKDLREFQAMGSVYSRPRNSFILPADRGEK